MAIVAFGLNHRDADIDLRGRASILPQQLRSALDDLVASVSSIEEAMILSTCNRTEVHCAVQSSPNESELSDQLNRWLAGYRNIALSELDNKTYIHWDHRAIQHIMRVAAGLDSQILGEPEIFGQYKFAYQEAQLADTIGRGLDQVVLATTQTCKKIRTHTEIGQHSMSIAHATITRAQQIFSDFESLRAMLIGAGATIKLVAQHLRSAGIHSIGVANRTLEHAQSIVAEHGGQAIPLAEFGEHLHKYDLLISSTNSPTPVVSKEVVTQAYKKRRYRPFFIADLAVPRDVDPFVDQQKNVYLYTIDDLSAIVRSNLALRQQQVTKAEKFISEGSEDLEQNARVRNQSHVVAKFRRNLESIRDQEAQDAIARLQAGEDPQEIIASLANTLTQKLAHPPTIALRNASANGDTELLRHLHEAYGIE